MMSLLKLVIKKQEIIIEHQFNGIIQLMQDGTQALQQVAASHNCIPRAFVPDFPDIPSPQTTQEDTLRTTPDPQGCHSHGFTAA